MTKTGLAKTRTLGRLIFGEKRKQHVSPCRTNVCPVPPISEKNFIDIHDWAIWRMQLNEQLSSILLSEQQNDMKQMRQYLQSTSFYQKHRRDSSNRRLNIIRLLFSIPRAKFKTELFDEINVCEQNSDERTTSVTSVTALQLPIVSDQPPVNQIYSKGFIGNTDGSFVQINEQMLAVDGIRSRRSRRNSFKAPDRLHSTLEKAVKDGNVLEKIKAFEMQAAAAAAKAESVIKSNTFTHRTPIVPSMTHRTLSPIIIHPISSIRTRHIHPIQQSHHNTYETIVNNELLDDVHDDILLQQRPLSQKTLPEEDYSMTIVSAKTKTGSQDSHHHRRRHHHHRRRNNNNHHHRTNASHSKQRREKIYDAPKHSSKSNKSSSRRRWLKGRKHGSTEGLNQIDKQEQSVNKSTKISKAKVNPTDNNCVYGVPKTELNEQLKSDSIIFQSPPIVEPTPNKKLSIQRRTSKKHQAFQSKDTNNADLFIENTSTIVRHQSIINISRTNSHRASTIRRYASQYSTDEQHLRIHNQDEQDLYETPHSEHHQQQQQQQQPSKPIRTFRTMSTTGNSNNRKQISKQILHAIMNSMNNKDATKVNETFFEHGPHTNPDEVIANLKLN